MSKRSTVILIVSFALFAFMVRLAPHAPNMTPLGALALTAGIFLRGRWTWAVPLVVLFVTDLVLGGYAWPVMLSVYGSFALITWVGRLLKTASRPAQIIVGSASASLFFFLTTNFAVWAWTPMYEKTWQGLMLSYTLAIPFFRNMFIGDLFYTTSFLAIIVCVQYLVTVKHIYGTTAIGH